MKIPRNPIMFLIVLSFPAASRAALYTYEGFEYPIAANGLAGQNGATGFTTSWDDVANDGEIVAPALSYTDGGGRTLVTSGNMARMDGSTVGTSVNFRTTDFSLYSADTVLYVSMLGQKVPSGLGSPLDSRAVNLALFSSAAELVGVGHGTNVPAGGFGGEYRWGIFTNGNGANGQVGDTTFAHYSAVNIQESAFSVLKIELNWDGLNERLTYYANPSLAAEPGTPSAIVIDTRDIAVVMSDITRIRPFAGNQNGNGAGIMNIDEIRIGSTWADVTPFIPEPGTAALAGLASLALLRRRR